MVRKQLTTVLQEGTAEYKNIVTLERLIPEQPATHAAEYHGRHEKCEHGR
jgi:hypothetical protein